MRGTGDIPNVVASLFEREIVEQVQAEAREDLDPGVEPLEGVLAGAGRLRSSPRSNDS